MLKKFQDMGKLLNQAKEMKSAMGKIQDELKKTEIPISAEGGKIKIVINGEMDVKTVSVDPSLLDANNQAKLENALKNAMTEAIKKAKDIAANKLSAISGGFLPGQ